MSLYPKFPKEFTLSEKYYPNRGTEQREDVIVSEPEDKSVPSQVSRWRKTSTGSQIQPYIPTKESEKQIPVQTLRSPSVSNKGTYVSKSGIPQMKHIHKEFEEYFLHSQNGVKKVFDAKAIEDNGVTRFFINDKEVTHEQFLNSYKTM